MTFPSFIGGVHPKPSKEATQNLAVEVMPGPDIMYVPLAQHIGAPAKAIVQKGDTVKKGQLIGENGGFVSANIHSPVSGVVKEIKKMYVVGGNLVDCIVIENDKQETVHEDIKPYGNIDSLDSKRLLEIVREIGLVGMGGATFPTHVKLSPQDPIDTVILNGAECEPYLTSDHRLMLEESQDVVDGLRIIMKILNVSKGYIGIEDNKPDAIAKMKEVASKYPNIEVASLHTKYPQGAEKQLIKVVAGREIPSGALPAKVGCVVDNVSTAAQLARSVRTGMPLIDRICTVTGQGITTPKNVRIKIGTLYQDVIDYCGGFKSDMRKLISGGPMMGIAVPDANVPSNKGTSGLLCMSHKEAEIPPTLNCIRCGKCAGICPASLQPVYIATYATKDNFEMAEKYYALDCIECGSCSFICPSKRPLVQMIRVAKRQIQAQKRKESK